MRVVHHTTVFPVLVLLELIYVPPTVSSGDAQYSSLHGCAVGLYRRCVYTQCAAMGWALRGVGLGALATRLDSAACHPLLLGTHPKKVSPPGAAIAAAVVDMDVC